MNRSRHSNKKVTSSFNQANSSQKEVSLSMSQHELAKKLHESELSLKAKRNALARALACSTKEASVLLGAIPGYVRLESDLAQLRAQLGLSIAMQPRHYSELVNGLLGSINKTLSLIDKQVQIWLLDVVKTKRRLDNLLALDTELVSQAQQKNELLHLAERRAVIRSYIHKAQHKLKALPNLTDDQKSLQSKLDRFSPLDKFPNIISDTKDQIFLLQILEELEPFLEELLPEIEAIPEARKKISHPPLPVKEAIAKKEAKQTTTQANNQVDDSTLSTIDFSADVWGEDGLFTANESVTKQEVSETVRLEDSLQEKSLVDDSAIEMGEELAVELPLHTEKNFGQVENGDQGSMILGEVELQRGDTFYDLLMGETWAGTLPIIDELDHSERMVVAEFAYNFLQAHDLLRYKIGFAGSLDLVGGWSENVYIVNLDILNDTVTLLAARLGFIEVDNAVLQSLQKHLSLLQEGVVSFELNQVTQSPVVVDSLSSLWPALRAYVGANPNKQQVPVVDTEVYSKFTPQYTLTKKDYDLPLQAHPTKFEKILISSRWGGASENFEKFFIAWLETNYLKDTIKQKRPIFTVIAPMQIETVEFLIKPSADQKRWLMTHQIDIDQWRFWVRLLKQWRQRLLAYKEFDTSLRVYDMARVVCALEELERVQAKQSSQ